MAAAAVLRVYPPDSDQLRQYGGDEGTSPAEATCDFAAWWLLIVDLPARGMQSSSMYSASQAGGRSVFDDPRRDTRGGHRHTVAAHVSQLLSILPCMGPEHMAMVYRKGVSSVIYESWNVLGR